MISSLISCVKIFYLSRQMGDIWTISMSSFSFQWLSVSDDRTPQRRSRLPVIVYFSSFLPVVLDFFRKDLFLCRALEHSGGIRDRVIVGIHSCNPWSRIRLLFLIGYFVQNVYFSFLFFFFEEFIFLFYVFFCCWSLDVSPVAKGI